MSNSPKGHFTGKERLEMFSHLGRPMRKGAPAELAISDYQRIQSAIEQKSPDAKTYLEILNTNSFGMVLLYTEWLLNWKPTLANHSTELDGPKIVEECYSRWTELTNTDEDFKGKETTALFHQELHPSKYDSSSIGHFRTELSQGLPALVQRLTKRSASLYQELVSTLEAHDIQKSKALFDDLFKEILLVHDLCVELIALYPAMVLKATNQQILNKIYTESFTQLLTYSGLWTLSMGMTPEEIAGFLAEHLRAHFSGSGRKGVTEVVEEADRYRLIFEPCGSGGAVRRRSEKNQTSLDKLPNASPETWNRKGEVPGYCSHCAINELQSVKHFGFPVFVTEFQKDPNKPCGWTVYKDPNLIPEEYFTRLGIKKDPSLFKKLGKQ